MKYAKRVAISLVCSLIATSPLAQDTHDHAAHPATQLTEENIGVARFETSCAAEVTETFNRAVSLLHSFWFPEARATFERVLSTDPQCAIAYWGIALTHWGNPFAGLRSQQLIALGQAALEKGMRTGQPTERERAYLAAVARLFASADPSTQRARILEYEAAMEALAAAYPNDVEARIFWALAISQAAEPEDKTFVRQLKAGAILEPLFERMPKHPGLAHYIIHAYDVPPLAERALPAARAYADIAPAVPHALHMPSHTFTRVGMWRESVATNRRSAETAERTKEPGAVLHALDYMAYAYLQMGMDAEAKEVVERANRLVSTGANPFALAAIPARYALERRQWKDAANLSIPGFSAPPYVEAMTRFARAVGAARSGNPQAAAPEIDRLQALRDRALAMQDAYWAEIIDIQRRGAIAWVQFAEGKIPEALETMRAAADAEDATEKSAITPGPLAPAREMLGFMLFESGRFEEALAAFDSTIAKEPNRFLALYGAGRTAERLQRTDLARKYYRQIAAICADASGDRPELAHARRMAT